MKNIKKRLYTEGITKKEFIRLMEMSHVRTSPYYPQSNGKLERYHRTLKTECVRPAVWSEQEEAIAQIDDYVTYYNTQRLHSAIGYVTPLTKLQGRENAVFERRKKQINEAAKIRRETRQKNAENLVC